MYQVLNVNLSCVRKYEKNKGEMYPIPETSSIAYGYFMVFDSLKS